jgi:hypothetical protein
LDQRLVQRARELTADVTFRLGRPTSADAAVFTALMNETYLRKLPPAYYTWQFFDSSAPGSCLFAEHDSGVVAVYGLKPTEWLGPKRYRLGLTVDLVIKPSLRGSGLLLRCELEMEVLARSLGCCLLYASPNDEAYRPYVSMLGWQPAQPFQFCTIDAQCIRLDRDALPRVTAEAVRDAGPAVETVHAAYRVAHHERLVAERTAEWVAWRFGRNPRYMYRQLVFTENDAAVGYAVLKLFEDPVTGIVSGDIVDFMPALDDVSMTAEMLAIACQSLVEDGIGRVSGWLLHDPLLAAASTSCGFKPSGQGRNSCWKVLDAAAAPPGGPDTWFFSMADVELF